MTCIICDAKVHARARCHTCYVYLRRTGRDRTSEMAAAAHRRAFERMCFAIQVRNAFRLVAKAS